MHRQISTLHERIIWIRHTALFEKWDQTDGYGKEEDMEWDKDENIGKSSIRTETPKTLNAVMKCEHNTDSDTIKIDKVFTENLETCTEPIHQTEEVIFSGQNKKK